MKPASDILVLSFDEERLSAVRIGADGADGAAQRLAVTLQVDPFTDEVALVAQELRERLQPLGHPARQTIVCLPLNRAMITAVALPDMPADAVPGFLLLQAEREFLLPPGDMALGISRYDLGDGQRGALLAAVPASLYARFLQTLRLAGLKRVQVTLAAVAQLEAQAESGVGAFLLVGPAAVDVAVTAGGGIVRLRRLAANPPEAAPYTFDLPRLRSEVRITLGQLPAVVQRDLRTVEVRGPTAAAARLAEALAAGAAPASWRFVAVQPVNTDGNTDGNTDTNTDGSATAAAPDGDVLASAGERTGRRVAAGEALRLVLAPPAAPRRAGLLQRWTRRQLLTWAAGPAAVLLLIAAVLLFQWIQFLVLRSRWTAMAPRTDAVRSVIAQAKELRPWMTDQPENLLVLRVITEAFPKRSTVWATRLEIRDRREVTLAGKALSREAWLQMLDALRRAPGVSNLRVGDARDAADGRSPLSFGLSFTWQAVASAPAKQEKAP